MKHDSDNGEEKEVKIPVVKEVKCFMKRRLHKFFEQSEIDKEKCIIFRVISALHNTGPDYGQKCIE